MLTHTSWAMEMNDQQARQFLQDYIGFNQDLIDSWLNGASRKKFGVDLTLLSLEACKIGDACDLSGIALGSAMSLFKTAEGGYLEAQKVVECNSAPGELIPSEPLLFLDNLPKSKKQIAWSAKYARRNLFVIKT